MYKFRILSKLGVLQLKKIFISPSHRCNANCRHCYEKFDDKDDASLTTEKVKEIIDQFGKLGGILVYFCSGEFLLRKDALDLIKYVHNKGMAVSVTSNGLLLTEQKIDELKEAGLNNLIISIDSADPKKHDDNRGVKGIFDKSTKALEYAYKTGLSVTVWTYILKSTQNELDEIAKLNYKLTKTPVFVFFPLLSGHLFNRFNENLTLEEREKIRKEFNPRKDTLLEFPSENDLCRGGGNDHINITPSGEVTFCPPVPYSYGNIYQKSLKKCLIEMKKEYKKFFKNKNTGQCPVNFPEYRQNTKAKFIYTKKMKPVGLMER